MASLLSRSALAALCLSLRLGPLACAPQSTVVSNRIPFVPEALYGQPDGNAIDQLSPDDTVVSKRLGAEEVPLLDPQGQPVQWGNFKKATGVATVTCDADGTHVELQASHLIPNGLYNHFAVLAIPPGTREVGTFAIGGGAPLGARDGSTASAYASANGDLSLSVTVAGGALTFTANDNTSPLPNCLLDAYEFLLLSLYRIDGKPSGDQLGDGSTFALQVIWLFNNGRATEP